MANLLNGPQSLLYNLFFSLCAPTSQIEYTATYGSRHTDRGVGCRRLTSSTSSFIVGYKTGFIEFWRRLWRAAAGAHAEFAGSRRLRHADGTQEDKRGAAYCKFWEKETHEQWFQ